MTDEPTGRRWTLAEDEWGDLEFDCGFADRPALPLTVVPAADFDAMKQRCELTQAALNIAIASEKEAFDHWKDRDQKLIAAREELKQARERLANTEFKYRIEREQTRQLAHRVVKVVDENERLRAVVEDLRTKPRCYAIPCGVCSALAALEKEAPRG